MKTIERQIRNHMLTIELHPIDMVGHEADPGYIADEVYRVDGTRVHRDAFCVAIALLTAEAP